MGLALSDDAGNQFNLYSAYGGAFLVTTIVDGSSNITDTYFGSLAAVTVPSKCVCFDSGMYLRRRPHTNPMLPKAFDLCGLVCICILVNADVRCSSCFQVLYQWQGAPRHSRDFHV